MDPTMHTRANDAAQGFFRRSRSSRRALGALAAVMGIIAGLFISGPLAGATPTYKFYYPTETPGSVYVGATTTVTVTLYNANLKNASSSSNQPFGSAELTLGNLASSAVGTPTPSVTGWTATLLSGTPAVIKLTSLNTAAIQPGASVSVSFTITPTSATSIPITTVVKQSNDFSGTGNNFNNTGTDPTITVIPVTIAFATEPSAVQQSVTSTSTFYNICSPVAVSVMAGTTPVSGVSVTITNGGATDPGLYYSGTKLTSAGKTITSDSHGLATFGSADCTTSGLEATNLGSGYTLSASSPAASGSITSTPFSVAQFVNTDCTANCSSGQLTSPTNGTSGTINASFGTPGYKLVGSFGQGTLTCDNQVTTNAVTADPLVSQVSNASGTVAGTVTITFPKAVVNNLANNGTPLMQVCAGASEQFLPNQTAIPGAAYPYQGLLPDCPSNYLTASGFELCVVSRSKNAANEIIQIYASDLSDPSYW